MMVLIVILLFAILLVVDYRGAEIAGHDPADRCNALFKMAGLIGIAVLGLYLWV